MAVRYKGQKGFPEEELPGLRLNGKQELRRKAEGLLGERAAGAKIWRWGIVWCVQA